MEKKWVNIIFGPRFSITWDKIQRRDTDTWRRVRTTMYTVLYLCNLALTMFQWGLPMGEIP